MKGILPAMGIHEEEETTELRHLPIIAINSHVLQGDRECCGLSLADPFSMFSLYVKR
jgi:hypothetical protein